MVDQYGNYFCQNVLRSISPQSRLKILKALAPEIVNLSCSDVGTHSMQRLFEIVTLEEEKQIIFENIKDNIVDMALHPKGNFVLLATFQVLDKAQIEFII